MKHKQLMLSKQTTKSTNFSLTAKVPGMTDRPMSNAYRQSESVYKQGFDFFKRRNTEKFKYSNKYQNHPTFVANADKNFKVKGDE